MSVYSSASILSDLLVFTENETKALVESCVIKLRPKVFTTHDVGYLLASHALFARKFDQQLLNSFEKISPKQ